MELLKEIEESLYKEYACRRGDAPEVIAAIAALGKAVSGAEVWVVREDPREIWGIIPQKKGPPGVFGWKIPPRKSSEHWADYVARSADVALEIIETYPNEQELAIPEGREIYYNIRWISEAESSQEG